MSPQNQISVSTPVRRGFGKVIASGFFHALRRTPLANFRPFGVRDSESAMRLAPLGTLRCICEPLAERQGMLERRDVCRDCGNVVAHPERGSFERQLSKSEIRAVVKQLRSAGIRSSDFELPAEIMSLRQLNRYLAQGAHPGLETEALLSGPIPMVARSEMN